MNIKRIILFSIFMAIISHFSFAQIGNEDGRYDKIIDECYKILSEIRHTQKSSIRNRFTETGFQERSDFNEYINSKNLKWGKSVLLKYGVPPKDQISISEWRVASREKDNTSTSLNITFYFKKRMLTTILLMIILV